MFILLFLKFILFKTVFSTLNAKSFFFIELFICVWFGFEFGFEFAFEDTMFILLFLKFMFLRIVSSTLKLKDLLLRLLLTVELVMGRFPSELVMAD